jgi:phosphoribosyl 1,2-cyclic phosphate phosphodiesterase
VNGLAPSLPGPEHGLSVTILGCGSSGGVPRVGSGWGACDPRNPRNRRRRCSILVRQRGPDGTTQVLVDTSPDLREQLLDAGVTHLDAVVFTHDHADHTHGIDDLRPLVIHMRRRIDVWCDPVTEAGIRGRFDYCFTTPPGSDYPPILNVRRIQPDEPIIIQGAGGALRLMPFVLRHGSMDALGLRMGGIAYTPDVSAIPDAALAHLAGLDVWIIDALRHTPHPTHFSLSEALDWVERMAPRRAVLTNLHTDLDYAALAATLPPHFEPAHDGLEVCAQVPALAESAP